MTDYWRVKKYYSTRILIETQRVIASTTKDSLVCLTGAELEMLRNIVHYLERRSTFVSEYHKNDYLCPDNTEWDTICAIVAQLEEKLMGCDIDLLIAAINAQTDVLDGLMQCVCKTTEWQERQSAALPVLSEYVTLETVTYKAPDDTLGGFTPPPTDVLRCEAAQAIWLWNYNTYVATILPFANSTADALTAILVASCAFGALALYIGIPVATLSGIVLAIMAWGIDGSIASLVNWFLSTKDEIVCLLYSNLPSLAAAASAVAEYVDADVTLSYLEKLVLKATLASVWHYSWIMLDQEINDTWRASFVPGMCDFCVPSPTGCFPIGPCNLDDWSGGMVECVGNLATIKGGQARWVKESHIPAVSSYLVVRFIPRSNGYPVARVDWGLTRVGDGVHFAVITGVDYPVDIPVTVFAAVPSQCWLQECYLDVTQLTYWGAPLYWCLQDAPPL